jgi:hypothetical protein
MTTTHAPTPDVHIQALLKSGGFTEADPTIRPRLIAAVAAREKQGKTHFSLTAPAPIALFNVDTGLEGVIHKFVPEKTVLVYNVLKPDPQSKNVEKEANRVWNDLSRSFDLVLRNPSIRTIIFDTATEVWELLRLAYFGKITQVMPHHYVGCNSEFKQFLDKAYDTDKNLILVHKMKAEYINNERTGVYEMAGFGDTPYRVQAVIYPFRADKNERLADGQEIVKGEFGVRIFESRHNAQANDTYFVGPIATFPFVASMIIEGTSPDMYE